MEVICIEFLKDPTDIRIFSFEMITIWHCFSSVDSRFCKAVISVWFFLLVHTSVASNIFDTGNCN